MSKALLPETLMKMIKHVDLISKIFFPYKKTTNNYSIEDKNIVIATHNQGKVREFKIFIKISEKSFNFTGPKYSRC